LYLSVVCTMNPYTLSDTYSGVEGTHAKVYDIPPLTDRQIKANSVFERVSPYIVLSMNETSN
jgi:hypothetical protein